MMVSTRLPSMLLAATIALALAAGSLVPSAGAEGLQWRLEQPAPPESTTGTQGSGTPIGLGRVGDIEFAPGETNKGLLITDGNGSTVPAGVWAYNGGGWHELANVCGATDGRIAWAGPDEFWTVSDGRPGQAADANGLLPPLEDNTLCRFAYNSTTGRLEVVDSYASLGFQASSYQPMHAAACISSTDCWFGGAPLPAPQLGAFHLHWNGNSLEAEPNTKVTAVQDMRLFQGRLIESIGLPLEEQGEETIEEILHPAVLQEVTTHGPSSFEALHPESKSGQPLPEYAPPSPEYRFGSYPQALGFLHLSADEDSLWAAAGPVDIPPKESAPGALTVLRQSGGAWSQVLGPETEHTAQAEAEGTGKVVPENLEGDVVNSIAAEPGTSSAWLAVDQQLDDTHPNPTALATLVHVEADGSLSEEQLPSEAERAEGIGPKGAAYKIACPAHDDCWMITTQGWLFHLSEAGSRTLPTNTDPAFNGPLIAYRPPDEGLPQVLSDAPPTDDSGLEESQPPSTASSLTKATVPNLFATVTLPLLSDVHTRLVKGTTLELSFHLAVKARIRLLAKRHSTVVASTPLLTLAAGKRRLRLRLSRSRWPTKLDLETRALAPLPQASTRGSGVETVSTSDVFPGVRPPSGWGQLP